MFKSTKMLGEVAEDLLVKKLESMGHTVKKSPPKTKEYDLLINDKEKIEVKFDIMSRATGNIAIEIFNCRSKINSGISVTESDYWFHLVPGKEFKLRYLWCKTKELLNFSLSHKPLKTVTRAGDGNADLKIYKLEDVYVFQDMEEFKL